LKIAAISQRVDKYVHRNEQRDALDQRLNRLAYTAGLLPVPLPNRICISEKKSDRKISLINWVKQIGVKAIVLSGGNDLSEFPERDETENMLLDYAEEFRLPVLGICRGMQVLAVKKGGQLKKVKNHVNVCHSLVGELSGEVNSFHKSALVKLPGNFKILAKSSDGCIEAIRHNKLPWEGWMWHPERFPKFRKCDIDRMKQIFSEYL